MYIHRGHQLTCQSFKMADREQHMKLSKSVHCCLWKAQSKNRQATPVHAFTEVGEPFSFTKFILLRGDSTNYITSGQKHVDWLLSLAGFVQFILPCKHPWFVSYCLKLFCVVRGKILDLTGPRFVKIVKNQTYFKQY